MPLSSAASEMSDQKFRAHEKVVSCTARIRSSFCCRMSKNDETGGTLAFGGYSYNLTGAVAVYFDDTDSDGNPVTAYNIHLLADGASVEEMSELDFTSCMLAMSLPG